MGNIIAFGGGKGGSGKSFMVSLVGSLLAATGRRVVLVDLDLGAANLHSFFGISTSRPGMQDFLGGRIPSLEACVLETIYPRLFLIAAKGSAGHAADLPAAWTQRIIQGIRSLSHEFVLLDLGAGSSRNNLDFFLAASRGVIVTTPEPTAVENVFRFVHALFLRRIQAHVGESRLRELTRTCLRTQAPVAIQPADLVAAFAAENPEAAARLSQDLAALRFYLLLNQVRKTLDAEVASQLLSFYPKFFGPVFSLGAVVSHGDGVGESVMAREPFLYKNKTHAITRQTMGLVRQLLMP